MLRVGVRLPATIGQVGEYLADVVALEAAGADSIWLGDAAVQPAVGRRPDPQLEPWPLLAAMAAVTHRVRLGASATSAGAWPPALFAATVTTLERLSGGRVVVGLGLGLEPEQLVDQGLRFEDRGRRLDEFIDLVRRLWSGSHEPFEGEFYKVPAIQLAPGVRPQGPPILIGAGGDPDYERAARVGDGLIQPGVPEEQVATGFARARELRAAAGREGDFELWVEVSTPPDRGAWRRTLATYEATGATGVIASWDPRLVDLLRNPDTEDDRTDLLIATG